MENETINNNKINKKNALIHSLIAGLVVPFLLSLVINGILLLILPYIGFLAYIMFPLIYILPVIYVCVGVKYSLLYLNKKNSINDPGAFTKLATIYYVIILIALAIIGYTVKQSDILGIGIILVPSFYLFTKKYITKK